MQLQYPIALWLLLLIIPLIWSWIRARGFVVFGRSTGQISRSIWWSTRGAELTLLLVLIGALASPVVLEKKVDPLLEGVDIMVVLDLSKSMLAEDITPNRITAGRTLLQDFVAKRQSDRVGLIGFAGKPFILSPLTFDHAGLSTILGRTTVDTIRQELPGLSGTAIGDALLLARESLNTGLPRSKVILLVTDGEVNIGISPAEVLPSIVKDRIKIYSLGIGDPAWTELYTTNTRGVHEYFTEVNGTRLRARVDEVLLSNLANATQGLYQNAKNSEDLAKTLQNIDTLERSELTGKTKTIVHKLSLWLTTWVLGLIILWLVLSGLDPTSSLRIQVGSRDALSPLSMGYTLIPYSAPLQRIFLTLWVIGLMSILIIAPLRSLPQAPVAVWIDVSRSMGVRDVTDESSRLTDRLTLAKLMTRDHIVAFPPGTELSLGVFGGDSLLLTPKTLDRESVLARLEGVSIGMSPGGSALSSIPSDPKTQRLILTDGGDLADLPDSLKKGDSLMLIGSAEGGPIPVENSFFGSTYITENGAPVISRVDGSLIQKSRAKALVRQITNYSKSDTITRGVPAGAFPIALYCILLALLIPTRTRHRHE